MISEEEILQLQFHKLSSQLLLEDNLQKSLKKVLESARKMLKFSRVLYGSHLYYGRYVLLRS